MKKKTVSIVLCSVSMLTLGSVGHATVNPPAKPAPVKPAPNPDPAKPAPGPAPAPAPAPQQPAPPPPPTCRPVLGADALQDVHFQASDSGVCLLSFDRWDGGSQQDWGRDQRRGDGQYVSFTVNPDCNQFSACQPSYYNAGAEPSDAGSTSTQILDSSSPFNTVAGQTVKVTLQNPENLITKAYQLENQPQVTCIRQGQNLPVLANAFGYGTEVETQSNCSTDRRDVRLDRSVPGLYLDTLTPQLWVENDVTQLQNTYSTDVTINVLPVDYPDAYPISGSISLTQGQAAVISASSQYFTHTAQLVSQTQDSQFHGTQVFNLESTINPIAPPNDITVGYDAQHGVLTINDADIAQLAHIDPNNKATYSVNAYVNWNRVFGHEEFGNVLAGRPEATQVNANEPAFQVSLEDALEANANYKKQIAGGGVTWSIYVEITTLRTNKYVQPTPTATVVYEINVNKKFTLGSIDPWSDPSKYR